jgi:hypothetical protein
MPKVLVYKFLTFFFFAGDINERAHVHVINSKSYKYPAKIWFEGTVSIFDKGNFSEKEILQTLKIVSNNKEYLTEQWNNFKIGKRTKLKVIKSIK